MTEKDKKLLLIDLCARLPYGVKLLRESWNYEWDQEMSVVETLEDIDNEGYINHTRVYKVEDIKPYLRSMDSMTEEEKNTYDMFFNEDGLLDTSVDVYVDWLNAHHFDYRGLIKKRLALEATKEMYEII